jgi:hypothetical protein
MSSGKNICVVCAWRASCQKKFSISGRDINCPDFVRDLSLPKEEDSEDKSKEHKTGKGKLKK